MPTSRTKRLLFSGAAALGVAAGAAGIAGAATGGQATLSQTPTTQAKSSTSSVTAPQGSDSQSDAGEAAALKRQATVTADQAKADALAAVPGTPADVSLDNENGNVVWSVTVTKADGSVVDVKIDAGNGHVLAQDAGDDSESGKPGSETTKEAPGATDPAGPPNA